MAAHKLDIFETLSAADRRDMGFFSRLDDDQRKGFAPPVVLRWMSALEGGDNELNIWLVNDRANINFHDIWEHPELQFKLMASCGGGRNQRHKWIPMATRKKKADKVREFLLGFYPDANDLELDLLLNQFTDETFEEFVLFSGSTPDETKEVLEAYARLTGKAVKKAKGRAKPKA